MRFQQGKILIPDGLDIKILILKGIAPAFAGAISMLSTV
jgi:hypothetical protein